MRRTEGEEGEKAEVEREGQRRRSGGKGGRRNREMESWRRGLGEGKKRMLGCERDER